MPQQQFKGYSEDQMKRIASKLGHTGGLDTLDGYLQGNPNAMNKYNSLNSAVTKRYAVGGVVKPPEGIVTTADTTLGQTTVNQSLNPVLPTATPTIAAATTQNANQLMTSGAGQLTGTTPNAAATQAAYTAAEAPTATAANLATTSTAAPAVSTNLAGVNAAQGTVSTDAQVTAAQQVGTSVSGLDAAQTTATQVEGAPTRTLEGGELVNPVADAAKAAAFTETITAAQADPSSRATVQGQIATLMTSFDEGKTPAWAAGAMRNVTAQLASRGIGSSSMAGQIGRAHV
jgi:hypothetical protein